VAQDLREFPEFLIQFASRTQRNDLEAPATDATRLLRGWGSMIGIPHDTLPMNKQEIKNLLFGLIQELVGTRKIEIQNFNSEPRNKITQKITTSQRQNHKAETQPNLLFDLQTEYSQGTYCASRHLMI